MGAFMRQVMAQQKQEAERDNFFSSLVQTFDKDILPELMLLGEFERKEVPMDNGTMMSMELIHYQGKIYVMKQTVTGKWFGEYHEIRD